MPDPITAADIETWHRVEAAIQGKAIELCAQQCERPAPPCRACCADVEANWRRDAFTIIQGGAAANQE